MKLRVGLGNFRKVVLRGEYGLTILQYFAGEHEACLRLERFEPILLSFPSIR